MKKLSKIKSYSSLITDLASLIEQGRKAAVRYVNTALVATYWLIGRRIVEYEQRGKERAVYGEELLVRLAGDLSSRFGKGFSKSNLFMMRAFYLAYPEQQIFQTLSGKLPSPAMQSVVQKVRTVSGISTALMQKFPLSWSHYCLLMRIEEPFKREFYEAECIRGNWT